MTAFLSSNLGHIVLTVLIFSIYFSINQALSKHVKYSVDKSNFNGAASDKARVVAQLLLGLIAVLFVCLLWGVKFTSILLFSTTMLTLLGVALFAQWSIISNITAYFVLLLHPSIRRGNYIRVMDMDNFIEGYVAELSLFNTKMITENREAIVYPNNLLVSRPIVVNPRIRFGSQGKINITDIPPALAKQKLTEAP